MTCIVWDLLVIHQHHTWQVNFNHMVPGHICLLSSLFILAISSFSVTSILSSWSPHTTTMRMPLTSQTVWLWCGIWSTRRQHRSTSSTVRYCFFFFPHVLISGFVHDKGKTLPSTPTCCTPLSLSSSFKPPLPSCTLWVHHAGMHLFHIYPQTHVREVAEKTCGAGVEWNPSTAAGLRVWGQAGYHVHLNKGPVFRRASRESS